MAVPKKKTSRSRSKMRRAHIKCVMPALSTCSNCKSLIAPHRVCPSCGFYKGKEVISASV